MIEFIIFNQINKGTDMFTFQNLPMVIIICLIVLAWLSFFSVIL